MGSVLTMSTRATSYIYCLHVIIPEADRDSANGMAEAISEDLASAFTDANISQEGLFPPTHIYVSARIKQADSDAFASALQDWQSYGLSAEPMFLNKLLLVLLIFNGLISLSKKYDLFD